MRATREDVGVRGPYKFLETTKKYKIYTIPYDIVFKQ